MDRLTLQNGTFRRLALPVRRFRTARQTFEKRAVVVVRLECSVGGESVVGWGEAAPLEEWGTESVEAVEGLLRKLQPPVGPFDVRGLDDVMPGLNGAPATRFAVETACLDAVSRAQGVPLRRLLGGGRQLEHVAVNGVLGADANRSDVEELIERGFDCVKAKLATDDVEEAGRRTAALREMLPTGVALRLDANGRWSFGRARSFMEGLEGTDIEYVEQPVGRESRDALVRLARNGCVPVAADESAHPVTAARQMLEDGIPVLVLKPMALGGLLRARDLAGEAEQAGSRVVWTSAIESAVGRSALVHLAAACSDRFEGSDGFAGPHGLAVGEMLDDDVNREAMAVEGGRIRVPDTPGIGIEVDDSTLQRLEAG